MNNISRAFWLERCGVGKIREESLTPPQEGWCRIAADFSGLSPGTERLVALGRVPTKAMPAMRCQYMDGEFSFPIKYGYSLVGAAWKDLRRFSAGWFTQCILTKTGAMWKSMRFSPYLRRSRPGVQRLLQTSKQQSQPCGIRRRGRVNAVWF